MFRTNRRVALLHMQAMRYQTLLQQIPRLRTCQSEMAHSVSQLEQHRQLGRLGIHMYVMLGLDTLAEVHGGVMRDLEEQRYLVAQTLARTGIAYATHVLYVLGDAKADRLSGGLRYHLDARRARADAWSVAAPADEATLARAQAQWVDTFSRAQPWYADAPSWPSLGEQADAVGIGKWVHAALCVVANDEQALAQELLGAMECEQGSSRSEREAAHQLRRVKHGSHAVHLEAISLWLFTQVLLNTAMILRDKVAITVAESTASQVDDLLLEHERIAELLQQEDNNVYFHVGG